MDTTIFRKPETTFNHSFNEVIELARKAKEGDSEALATSFICENFPKNSFMRVNNKGVFNIYHIRGDTEILSGGRCATSLRMIDCGWTMTKKLDDVFCALNYDTGMKMELSEVRRKVIEERKAKASENYPPFPSQHPPMDKAEVKTGELLIGEPFNV